MRSVRRLLPVLLPVAFLLGSCGDSYQVAARVGDLEITHDELAEKADAWAANDQLASELGVSPSTKDGAAPQAVVAEVLNLDIQAELARMALGDQADGPQLAELRSQVEQQFGELFAAFPEELRDATIDDVAVLQLANANGVTPPDADVYVSPRYGDVDATGIISVPAGAQPAPVGSAGSPAPTAPAAPSGP
ncbi:MAG: hypothetical protein U5K30_08330 [Acidimicrobiales bacterium]|nr:hypothetical protein [Acidimicrobiales bacterium]